MRVDFFMRSAEVLDFPIPAWEIDDFVDAPKVVGAKKSMRCTSFRCTNKARTLDLSTAKKMTFRAAWSL